MMLIDTHFHLDLLDNMQGMIQGLSTSRNIGLIAVGTTPAAFERERKFCNNSSNIRVGLGLHPQLILERAEEIDLFLSLLPKSTVVGEIGLDFSQSYLSSKEEQVSCFRKICKMCARYGGKTISIHSVRSAGLAIEILEETKSFKTCRCIFHWFTGSKAECKKAIENGAYFSINPKMLKTKGSQEIIRLIPENRLLLETDAPFACRIENVSMLEKELHDIVKTISTIRESADLYSRIEENTVKALTFDM